MKYNVSLLIFASFFTCGVEAAPHIRISSDVNDCVNSWVSMDVVVTVDRESFRFNPSCKFSFNQSFKTKEGVECKIEAGMCSAFSPKNKIEVSCQGSSVEAVGVSCP